MGAPSSSGRRDAAAADATDADAAVMAPALTQAPAHQRPTLDLHPTPPQQQPPPPTSSSPPPPTPSSPPPTSPPPTPTPLKVALGNGGVKKALNGVKKLTPLAELDAVGGGVGKESPAPPLPPPASLLLEPTPQSTPEALDDIGDAVDDLLDVMCVDSALTAAQKLLFRQVTPSTFYRVLQDLTKFL